MLICFALFLYGYCLGVIGSEDFYRFEIKLELLPMVALCGIGFGLLWGMPWQSLLFGFCVWFVPALIFLRLRPSSFGQGDIWLFGTAGLVLGVEYSAVGALLFGAFSVVTAWVYARRRGKGFGRSLFPAAIPMVIALLVVVQWRLFASLNNASDMDPISFTVLLLAPAGILLGAMLYQLRMAPKGGPAR